MTAYTLTICETCQTDGAARAFGAEVQALMPNSEAYAIKYHACFNACGQGPVVALQGDGWPTYLFGPLDVSVNAAQEAQDLAQTFQAYARGQGEITNPLECGRLRECLIACIPPMGD